MLGASPWWPTRSRSRRPRSASGLAFAACESTSLSKEYPPEVYGGAGVHVAELVRALRARDDLDARVRASARRATRPGTTAYADLAELAGANAALQTLGVDLAIGRGLRRRRPGALAHLVRQHGRPPRRRCCTASRTSSPRTASSRCGRGRPSSSAAATRVSSLGREDRVRGGGRGHRGERRRCATTSCAATPTSTRPGSTSCTTASTPSAGRRVDDPDARARARRRPRPAVGRLRRPDHPAEGAAATSCARPRSCRPTCSSCSAPGAPDTPEIEAEVDGLVDELRADPRRAWSGSARCCPAPRSSRCSSPATVVRLPVDLRAARHRQPRGDGLRDRRRRHRDRRHPRGRRRRRDRAAGADRAGRTTAPAPRSTPTRSSPTSPPRSPRSSATPTGPRAMGRAGRQRADASTSPGTSIARPDASRSTARSWPDAAARSAGARFDGRRVRRPGGRAASPAMLSAPTVAAARRPGPQLASSAVSSTPAALVGGAGEGRRVDAQPELGAER